MISIIKVSFTKTSEIHLKIPQSPKNPKICILRVKSVLRSCIMAPALGKNFDAAAAPAPTILYSKAKFLK
jgi:hypothetical protein